MKLFEIRPNKSGKVRTNLCIEDVKFNSLDVLKGFNIVTELRFKEEGSNKHVLLFSTPFRIPKFNRFYASRIKSVDDPYLLELVKRLLYLNPHPDKLMIKKLTEYIILNFSVLAMTPSEVATSTLIAKPILKFEEVEPVVRAMSVLAEVIYYRPDNEDMMMFYRESNYSKSDKIKFRARCRQIFVQEKLEQVIHTVAEHLIDMQYLTKVTGSRIENTKMVAAGGNPATVRTIRKYMSDRTRKVIDEHNQWAPFKSDKTFDKYVEFLSIPSDASLEEITSKLGISKGTAVEFRQLAWDRGES